MSEIDLTGMILKGRYCILEQIGSGGEGSLYLAKDMELGGLWAVKELPLSRRREAKLLRLLEHPSIPRMIDYIEKEEACYLVMEYIRGKSVQQWLEEGKKFTAQEILDMGIKISRVLDYLHTQKPPVYYGDLKPANLMLTESDILYLVDFGSAVSGYSHTPGVCQGTVGFAAPEQFEGKVGAESDIYALGKTLRALAGNRWWKLVFQVPKLLWFVRKCCRKSEKKRFSNGKKAELALCKIRKRVERGRHTMLVCFGTAATILTAGAVFLYAEQKPDFSRALTKVTWLYEQKEFLSGEKEIVKQICEKAEEELLQLWKEYPESREQKRILLLLAVNGELMDNQERAKLYYEQLLIYAPGYTEGYGQYGMFLLRQGEKEESKNLWQEYQSLKSEGKVEDEGGRTFAAWKEKMNEEPEKKAERTEESERKTKESVSENENRINLDSSSDPESAAEDESESSGWRNGRL